MALDSIIGPFTLLDKNSKGARDGKEMKEKRKDVVQKQEKEKDNLQLQLKETRKTQ